MAKLIVGLGNPGAEYAKTRHNVGFMVIDELIKTHKVGKDVVLLKPQMFMNESGKAVKKVLKYQGIKVLKDLWVIHDDLDIELGRIKIHAGGSSGHHGIESIIKEINSEDFVKFRVGIGRPKMEDDKSCYYRDTKDYLLSPFTKEELPIINTAIIKTAQAVISALKEGIDKSMNEFNK